MRNGAKICTNPRGEINVTPEMLEHHLDDDCLSVVSEEMEIDDEDLCVRVVYSLFRKPADNYSKAVRNAVAAWSLKMEDDVVKKIAPQGLIYSGWAIDPQLLDYFTDRSTQHLLSHPVVESFVYLELYALNNSYVWEFLLYLFCVGSFFSILLNYYDLNGFRRNTDDSDEPQLVSVVSFIALAFFIALTIAKDLWSVVCFKKKYFSFVGALKWSTMVFMVIVGWFKGPSLQHRHLAALALLTAFACLFLLLVRILPKTIRTYINMFTTVQRNYLALLMIYSPFLISFAYCFYLTFSARLSGRASSDNETEAEKGLCRLII